jgi:hypothetical protein
VATKKSERIKMYVVAGLAVVMVGNVYFRFIHPKLSSPEGVRTASAATSVPITIPQVTIEEPSGNLAQGPSSPPFEGSVRDLFAPLVALPKPEPPKPAPQPPKPPPAFKLKGTIFGGEKAIAVIDDHYVRIGQSLGEFKVVRIGKKEVVIESEDRQITLEIMKNE